MGSEPKLTLIPYKAIKVISNYFSMKKGHTLYDVHIKYDNTKKLKTTNIQILSRNIS